ncbi:sacsin N-terminal ATP-binding-like domain-containing protein [Bradyrhizobium sp. BR 1433]|uniref:sacsin N-terminal ATP-binding-like domain-containing protein n=1 Tax=Bradyrhizobium sp. BR 1433 TaxID=3447967 RepID=UPI003EE524C1
MSSLTTPPRAIFRQIQANLSDRYSSGFPVLKELIQNAEDAGAKVIRFVAHPGWPIAKNPLLRVPGFAVANDGRFEAKDARGILSFADTAKGDEVAAIGRFGFGQKAVFHLCDAFIVHSLGHAVRFSEVVNPCLGVIESTRAGSWDEIDSDDLGLLETATGDIKRGLALWLPLRCEAVQPAPRLFFTDYRPTGAALLDDLTRHEADLRLILASMRYLDRIEAFEDSTLCLALRRNQDSQRLLGPPAEDREPLFHGSRAVAGMIDGHAARSTQYAGLESYGVSDRLKQLKQASDWPQVPVFTTEGEVMQPEKAAEHGAVVVVESRDAGARGVSLDWGVFLPIAEAAHLAADVPALRIMLHGYFFVDSGRRYIEGFASYLGAPGTGTIYQQWNETLRDDLVLPLLPGVLHYALQQQMLTSAQLAEVTAILRRSPFGREHRAAIAACDVLARRVRSDARGMATWELLSSESRLRPLPAPDARGHVAAAELLPELCDWAERRGLTLIAEPESALTKATVLWEPLELADLLTRLAPEVFLQGGRTAVLAAFVDVAVAGDGARQAAAAEPLLAALRQALASTRALAPGESIAAVLAHLPVDAAIALPPSAGERAVLGALASATGAPLCLRAEWLAEGAARRSLSPAEAAPLLAALQPLLRDERTADAAGAAAVALVKLLGRGLDEAAHDPAYAQLPVLRAGDGRGVARLSTLPDLVSASRDGRLFRDNPRVRDIVGLMARATPNLGTVIVTGATAELLADIGAPFTFAEGRNEVFARLIGGAQEFGPAEARAKLLDRVYTDSSDARSAFRALAAGDARAGDLQARLFTLPQTGGLLDDLALRLIEGSADDFLVPTVVAQELKPAIQNHLVVSAMDGDGLGRLLAAHAAALGFMNLHDAEVSALLTSDIPDQDLQALPIFLATDGRRYPAAAVHRETSNWKVPPALVAVVPILKLPSGQKAVARTENSSPHGRPPRRSVQRSIGRNRIASAPRYFKRWIALKAYRRFLCGIACANSVGYRTAKRTRGRLRTLSICRTTYSTRQGRS